MPDIHTHDIAMTLLDAEQMTRVAELIHEKTGAKLTTDGHQITLQITDGDGRPLATTVRPVASLTVQGCYRLAASMATGVRHLQQSREWLKTAQG